MGTNKVISWPLVASLRLATLLLLLVVATISLNCQPAIGAAQLEQTLREVCAQSKPVPIFSSPNKVKQLIEFYKQSPELCPDQFSDSFHWLKSVLDDDQVVNDICSMYAYERIRRFHLRFIHYYKPELSRQEVLALEDNKDNPGNLRPIPLALRQFFILFVKQINSSCKQELVLRLEKIGNRSLIDEEEFALLARYKDENQRLMTLKAADQLMAGKTQSWKWKSVHILNFDLYEQESGGKNATFNATFNGTFNGALNGPNDANGKKLYIKVKFNDRLKRIKDACDKKFKPIYSETFAPVIRLNNLGYIDYTKSKREDELLENDTKLSRWMDIIEACEVLGDVEIIHDSRELAAIADIIVDSMPGPISQKRALMNRVQLLTREEWQQLATSIAQQNHLVIYDPEQVELEHEKLKFTPTMWLHSQQEVEREIRAFETDIRKYVQKRKSYMRFLLRQIQFQLAYLFHKNASAFVERNQSTVAGQLNVFFDRHQSEVRTVLMIVGFLVAVSHLALVG